MKEYTGSNMQESDKALYLENARITNSFIKRKMECSVMEYFEMNLGYAIWAKKLSEIWIQTSYFTYERY